MGHSMHEGVQTWCDTCCCEAEPRWLAAADEAESSGALQRMTGKASRTLRIHVLQHVPFEGPGAIVEWADKTGHTLAATHAYRGDPLPSVDDFDLLVAMGGPMSVNDTARHVWIEPEARLIRQAMEAGKPVLGVCLGGQLLAKALGARVYPGREKEIGWFPVSRVDPKDSEAFAGFPETFTPLHWHGETFELPEGAVRLAETEVCPNQAFQFGRRAVGLQFHLEATPESVEPLVEQCGGEITGGRFQQPPEQIRDCEQQSAAVRPVLYELLDYLTTR